MPKGQPASVHTVPRPYSRVSAVSRLTPNDLQGHLSSDTAIAKAQMRPPTRASVSQAVVDIRQSLHY